jgi:Kef-type K+ transport system membrane component KefB
VSFTVLAVICLVGLAGPLLALPRQWHLPVVLGELLAGVLLGRTGLGYLDAGDETFSFLAEIGFALVMFVAGTHVPVRDARLLPALRSGLLRALAVGLVGVGLGYAVAAVAGTGHALLYAVLMASSSAAVVLPVRESVGLDGPAVLELLPQVAVADAACIVLLPLAIDPDRALRAGLGALAVVGCGVAAYVAFAWVERAGWRGRVHDLSEERSFAIELRVSLAVLFAIAALAVALHVSIMLAGFALGLAVSAVGEPRRVAKQLFAITEGLFGPLFFVWFGASLGIRALASHPGMVLLGGCLGAGALVAHLVATALGQPLALSLLAAAQLGVPVAAVTIGTQLELLQPGEAAALVLGALVTVVAAVAGGSIAVRAERTWVPPWHG